MAAAPASGPQIVNNPGFDTTAAKAEAQRIAFQVEYPSSAPMLDVAIATLRNRQPWYDRAQRYYDGEHPIIIASYDKKNKQFFALFKEFSDNLCRVPVDAIVDRLQIREFSVEQGAAQVGVDAWAIWKANRMTEAARRVHREALRQGDAYVLVWPDEEGTTRIYPQRAKQMMVDYDPEKPEEISWAAKWWIERANRRIRVNLYFPDRIEKYVKPTETDFSLPTTGKSFERLEVTPHPYGRVPVFHFANDSDDGLVGRSELQIVVPLQNGLNKALLDMLVGSEYHALPQRWITGLEVLRDENGKAVKPFEPGADKIWTVANEQAKFGQFDAANLEQFLKVANDFRTEVARVTGLPMHYMNVSSGQQPSGEALRTSEARLVQKVVDRQGDFGDVWEDVMAFALKLEKKPADAQLEALWVDPQSISTEEKLNQLVLKQTIGVSEEQLLSEAGYGKEDVKRIMEEKQAAVERQQRQFDAGNTGNLNAGF